MLKVFAIATLSYCLITSPLFQSDANRSPEKESVAVDRNEKGLSRVVALSKTEKAALLGSSWLVIDGHEPSVTIPSSAYRSFYRGRAGVLFVEGGSLVTVTLATGERHEIVALPERVLTPASSPDGRHVAYVSHDRIKVLDSGTGKVTEYGAAWATTPSWSPDGRFVAFEKNRDREQGWGYSEVAVVSLETGVVTVLDKGRFPSWSPQGDAIAYTDVDGKQLRTIKPNGLHARVLKRNWAAVMGPIEGPLVWSPDQNRIIFHRVHDDLYGESHAVAYLMDIRSGDMNRLIKNGVIFGWR